MAEKRSRRHRAVRSLVYVALTPVLVLGGYLCSVVSLCFLASAGILPAAVFDSGVWECFVGLASWYYDSHLPGAEAFNFIVELACDAGESIQYGS